MSKSFQRLADELSIKEMQEFLENLRFSALNFYESEKIDIMNGLQMRLIDYERLQDDDDLVNDSLNYRYNLDLYDAVGVTKYRELYQKLCGEKIYINLKRIEKMEFYLAVCRDFENRMTSTEVANKHGISSDYAKKIKRRYAHK